MPSILSYNFPKILKTLTGQNNWKELDGPDSGCGVDYWYKSGESEAYINTDQDHCTISVNGESVFSGDIEELD